VTNQSSSFHLEIVRLPYIVLDGGHQLVLVVLALQTRDLEYLLVILDLLLETPLSLNTVGVDPLTTNSPSELHVLAHDGDSLGMDSAQVRVFE
jgi:hypothetical protein